MRFAGGAQPARGVVGDFENSSGCVVGRRSIPPLRSSKGINRTCPKPLRMWSCSVSPTARENDLGSESPGGRTGNRRVRQRGRDRSRSVRFSTGTGGARRRSDHAGPASPSTLVRGAALPSRPRWPAGRSLPGLLFSCSPDINSTWFSSGSRVPIWPSRQFTARVREGGHNVPEVTIRRRFEAGLSSFFRLYQPISTTWQLCDNSGLNNPRLIASGEAAHTAGLRR